MGGRFYQLSKHFPLIAVNIQSDYIEMIKINSLYHDDLEVSARFRRYTRQPFYLGIGHGGSRVGVTLTALIHCKIRLQLGYQETQVLSTFYNSTDTPFNWYSYTCVIQ